jgi:acyl-CoA thioester hydrolase
VARDTAPDARDRYPHFTVIDTRWMDNDDIASSDAIGLVVETGCRYFRPLAFPDRVTAGLRVAHIGTSSVRYEIAVFRNDEQDAAAAGHFVHVYTDRNTRRPTPIPDPVRRALAALAERQIPG